MNRYWFPIVFHWNKIILTSLGRNVPFQIDCKALLQRIVNWALRGFKTRYISLVWLVFNNIKITNKLSMVQVIKAGSNILQIESLREN